ncbi:hypothetical protein CV102_20975 [Natronococcus pandeyae]|uniref:Uncharacterized protein n=1 Tax=Natronococcus pandeyae TaxID=2055836 RepID=A0A8J8Q422_9EURY|nr:hypothetical protein CV102_20975 [Natronococcus pandeyae]
MDETGSFGERFWRIACAYKPAWFALLGIEAMLLGLIAFSLWFGSLDSHTRAIMTVNIVLVGATFLACASVLFQCHRYERRNRSQSTRR